MAGFTEYVRLIAEGGEAEAMINKINAAIAKLRREASQPIKLNLKQEITDAAEAEKKLRGEKVKTTNQEKEAFERRKAEAKAIKAMNAEVGNDANNVRYGSPASIQQARRFNEQLEETTKRINRLADAHKHVKQTAKDAGVAVSGSLSEKLAQQTVGRTEKSDAQAIRDAATAEKERVAAIIQRQNQEETAEQRALAMRREQERVVKERQGQELEGDQRLIKMDQERVRMTRERQDQELEGEKRVIQIEQIKAREIEKAAREQARAVREAEREEQRAQRQRETSLAASREGGVRGIIGEGARDLRRNMIYGGIGLAEQGIHAAYDANKERDTAVENVRQAGRTAEQIAIMQANAQKLSMANPTLTATEILSMQQHNIGAFGSFDEGMANNAQSARYIALRKNKVGEEEALKENMSILKVGEESGRIRNPGFLAKLYNAQLQAAQAEGSQYDPKNLITTMRMLKSSKFGLSDDAMMTLLPFMGMSEGAARTGNQIAMFSKSMTMAGKQIKASGVDYGTAIAGTSFSDGKGGYNPEMQKKFMEGDLAGVGSIVDQYLRQKGFNPDDKSTTNVNAEVQKIAKAIGNTSAREALLNIWENREQFEKQKRMAAGAQGENVGPMSTRTLQGAQDALGAQANNAATAVMTPLNPVMIRMMNGLTVIEEMIAKNPGTASATIGAGALAGGAAAYQMVKEEPQLVPLGVIATNTGIIAKNTGITAGEKALEGKGGVLSTVAKGVAAAVVVGAVVEVAKAAYDYNEQRKTTNGIIDAAKSPENTAKWNKDTLDEDIRNKKFAQAQVDAEEKKMAGQPTPKGYVDGEMVKFSQQLAAATAKIEYDIKNPLVYRKGVVDDAGNIQHPTGGLLHPTGVPSFSEHPAYDKVSADNARKLDDSSAKDAIAKIAQSGTETAQTIASAGGTITAGVATVAGTIAGAGGGVVSALQAIAAQIASVKISGPAQTGPLGKSDPGPKERGNR